MKIHHARAALALALAATGGAATAQNASWYVGGSAGRSATTIDDARINSGLLGQGLASTTIADRERSHGYKLFGGYRFSPNLAVEAGYFDLGKFGYTATTVPAGSLNGDIRVNGLNLDLVGTLPLAGRLSALGRVGVVSAHSRDNFAATGAVRMPYSSANPSDRATGFKLGAGLAYDFTDSLGMRVEAERYRISDAVGNKGHVDLVSLGLVYRFGGSPAPARAAAPQPVMVSAAPAAAPAPPPAIIAAAPPAPVPPAAPMRITLSADSLFDFDKAVVKPAGRQALDKLSADLRGFSYDTLRVTGHTDRIGSHDYNLKLSQRRAQAVSDYLVESGGVPAGKLSSRGVDGAEPVTRPEDCKGSKPTPALIACLQPDRRVVVEVTATK
ncbi:MAG: outer membrane beta-barrel protein [Ramlibacter sp.]